MWYMHIYDKKELIMHSYYKVSHTFGRAGGGYKTYAWSFLVVWAAPIPTRSQAPTTILFALVQLQLCGCSIVLLAKCAKY